MITSKSRISHSLLPHTLGPVFTAICVAVVFMAAGLVVLSDAHAQTTHEISNGESLALTNTSYKNNLIHLTGNYYVSSHTVGNYSDVNLDYDYVIRLYSIIGGEITLIDSRILSTFGPSTSGVAENLHPISISLTRIDDDTVAVALPATGFFIGGTGVRSDAGSYIFTADIDTTVDNPRISEVTNFVNYGTAPSYTLNPSLVALDANRLVLAHAHPHNLPSGSLNVFRIDSTTGELSRDGTTSFAPANQGRYSSMIKLDDDTVVVAYRSSGADGVIRTFDIGAGIGSPVTQNAELRHESGRISFNSLVRVDADTVALAYSEIGDRDRADDGSGRLKLFDISATDGSIMQRGSTLTYYNTAAAAPLDADIHHNSLALLDDDTLALAYRGESGDGFIRTYDITATGLVSNGGSFEHDTANGAFNALLKVVGDDALALVYSEDYPDTIVASTNTANTIKVINVVNPNAGRPIATISADTPNGSTHRSNVISYNVDFTENVTGFVAAGIMISGTASLESSPVSNFAGSGASYSFDVTTTSNGVVIVSIREHAVINMATTTNPESAPYTVTVDTASIQIRNTISKGPVVELPDNGYRHNLIHLAGEHYVSSHTVSVPDNDNVSHTTTLRLYTITDGMITLDGSDTINTIITVGRGEPTGDLGNHPTSTSIVRVRDDAIAITYAGGTETGFQHTVSLFGVVVNSPTSPFTSIRSENYESSTITSQIHPHSLITFDSTRLIVAYPYLTGGTLSGFMRDINIGTGDTLSTGSAFEFAAAQGRYPSMVKLDDNTIVAAYRTGSAVGNIQAFDITTGGTVFTPGTALVHDTSRTSYPSIVKIDDDTVALAYSNIGVSGNNVDGSGHLKIFDIAAADGSIMERSSVMYTDTVASVDVKERAHLNSLVLLDSDTLAVAYRGGGGNGFIQLYDVTLDTGALTASSELIRHDEEDGAFNSLVKVDDTTLALVYGGDLPSPILPGTVSPNKIRTFSVTSLNPDTAPPVIISAKTTSDTTIVLTASELLDGPVRMGDFAVPFHTVSGIPVVSDRTITITVEMPILPNTVVRVNYSGNAITDAAENRLAEFELYPVTNNVRDTERPTVTLIPGDGGTPDDGIQNTDTVSYIAIFGEDVTDFTLSDISVTGNATFNSPAASDLVGSPGSSIYTFNVRAISDGTVIVSIPEGVVKDPANNGNAPSNIRTVTVDTTPPTIDSIRTVNNLFNLEIVATEPLIGTTDRSEFSTSTAPRVSQAFLENGNIRISVLVSISDDSHTITYTGSSLTDAAGNRFAAFQNQPITPAILDTVAPAATVDAHELTPVPGSPNTRITNSATISYRVVFTEPVLNFVASDIVLTGTASGGSPEVSTFGTPILEQTFPFEVETTSDGTVIVSIPANVAEDRGGNGNTESAINTVIVDTTPPDVQSIEITSATTITITASEVLDGSTSVEDFTVSDNTVLKTEVSERTITLTVETVMVSTDAPTVTYQGSSLTDVINNALGTFTNMSVSNNLSKIPLTVTIITNTPNGGTQNTDIISYTAAFNKVVTDFDMNDITISGTAAGGFPTISNFAGSGIIYTFDVTTILDGTVTVVIPENAVTDMTDNGNAASNTYTITLDILVPVGTFVNSIGRTDGMVGIEDGEFEAPYGITATPTQILVTDSRNHRVQIFGLDGEHIGTIGSRMPAFSGSANGVFNLPRGITTTSTNILVADANNHRVQIFDLQGTYVSKFGSSGSGDGEFSFPQGIITNSTHILVTDSTNNNILIFDNDYNYVGSIDGSSDDISADGQFDAPSAITTNSTHILVTETGNNRIQVFDMGGNFVSKFGSAGTGDGQFDTPRGIAITSTHILVVDTENDRIQVFDLDGNFVSKFGSTGSGDGQFESPLGITTNSTHILVTDGLNHRVQIFDRAPTVTISADTPNDVPQSTGTISYTATFSESVTGFDAISDISVSGTAIPTASALTGSGTTYNFDVTSTSEGTVVVSIPKLVATDTAGNRNFASDTHTVEVSMPDFILNVSDSPVITDDMSLKFFIVHTDTPAISDQFDKQVINSPNIVRVSAPPGSLDVGDTVAITVTFDNQVDVSGGTPQLTLNTGVDPYVAIADYTSGSGTTALVFTYTVAAGHNSADLDYVGIASLSLNEGTTITATAGGTTAANLALPATGSGNSLADTSAVVVDTAPIVTIIANNITGGFITSSTISYTATFSEPVNGFTLFSVGAFGSADLKNALPIATNLGGSRGDTTYTFDVETTSDGTVNLFIVEEGVSDSGGTYNRESDPPYLVTVNTSAPAVSSVSAKSGLYGVDRIVSITVTFDEDVVVSGIPTLTLETGGATNTIVTLTRADSNGVDLIFGYTVAAGHSSTDLNYVDINSLSAGTGTITARDDGSTVVLTLPATTTDESLGGSSDVVLDTIPLTVTITNAETANNGDTTNSNTLTYTATFSKPVIGFNDMSDVTVGGMANTTFVAPTPAASPADVTTTYTFVVTPTSDGTVIVSIPAGAAKDAAQNLNVPSDTYTVTVDISGTVDVSAPFGTFVSTFGSSGEGDGQFDTPRGITTNSHAHTGCRCRQPKDTGI